MTFTEKSLPNGSTAYVPSSINVTVPRPEDYPDTPANTLHSLAYIPWDSSFLSLVPPQYQDFYQSILPKLNARTTDVHTALSVSHVEDLVALSNFTVNKKLLTIAVLLHDIGWAELTPSQIALSLNYSAFAYTEDALLPKRLHASRGAEVANAVLAEQKDALGLSDDDLSYIVQLVRYHDQIDPWPSTPQPSEYLLLGDADRIWSYTRHNFWLDTIRKNTQPRQYIENITAAIDEYFLTDAGKLLAKRHADDRLLEVIELEQSAQQKKTSYT
jgi:hypothetical protein